MPQPAELKELTPSTAQELKDFLLPLCETQLTQLNPTLSKTQLVDHIQKQFAILRLQATADEKNPWAQLSHTHAAQSFNEISENHDFSQLAVNFCNMLIKRCQQEITPETEIHWSVTFLKNNYEQRILERFVELEKYDHIAWLSKEVQTQKKMLFALHALPQAAETFFSHLNKEEKKSPNYYQGRQISLVEAILKQTSDRNAGFACRAKQIFIEQILINIDIKADEASFNNLYMLYQNLYPDLNDLPTSNNSLALKNDFINNIIRPFSIQDFLYETITKPCADLSNKIFLSASLLDRASQVTATSSWIDRVTQSYLIGADIADCFANTRVLINGVKTLAHNSHKNELSVLYNALTYYIPILDTNYQNHLLYKIFLTNEPNVNVSTYSVLLNANLNLLLDIAFFLEGYPDDDQPTMFEDIKQLFTLDIEYGNFLSWRNQARLALANYLKVDELSNYLSDIPTENLEEKFKYYVVLLYKIHLLEKDFLKIPAKGIQEKFELLQSLKQIINHKLLNVEFKRHCITQYETLYYHFYSDHFKLFIEQSIDTAAPEFKSDENNDAIVFNGELAEWYTQLESRNFCLIRISLFENNDHLYDSLADLKRFYVEYKSLSKDSLLTAVREIKQTPRQKMQQIIDPHLKSMLGLILNSAINVLRSLPSIPPSENKYEPNSTSYVLSNEYHNAYLARLGYVNALLSTLRTFKYFIEKNPKFSQALAYLSSNPSANLFLPNVNLSHVAKWMIQFGPSNSSESGLSPQKIIEYCIATYLPLNLAALHDSYQIYTRSINLIYDKQPEVIFTLTDPLDSAHSEALAMSVMQQIYTQFNIAEYSQSTISAVLNSAVSLMGAATPAGYFAHEIINSQTLQLGLAQITPDCLSSTLYSLGEEGKKQILQQIGIAVREKTINTVQTCFNKFNISEEKSVDSCSVSSNELGIFINFISNLYALTLHIGNDDEALKKILRQILLTEGINTQDIDNLLIAFNKFRVKYVVNDFSLADSLIEIAGKVDITNRFQLLLLRKRIEIYHQSLDHLDPIQKNQKLSQIQTTLLILNRRITQENPFYSEIIASLNEAQHTIEINLFRKNITALNTALAAEKDILSAQMITLKNDKGPARNWLNEFNKSWLIPLIKLTANTTPVLSATRTSIICLQTLPTFIPLIMSHPAPLIPLIKYALIGLSGASTFGLVTLGLITVSFLSNTIYELYLSRNEWLVNKDNLSSSWIIYSGVKAFLKSLFKAAFKTILPYAPLYAIYKMTTSVYTFASQSLKSWWLGDAYRKNEIDILQVNMDNMQEVNVSESLNNPMLETLDLKIQNILTRNIVSLISPLCSVRLSIERLKKQLNDQPKPIENNTPEFKTTAAVTRTLQKKPSQIELIKPRQMIITPPSITLLTVVDIQAAITKRKEYLESYPCVVAKTAGQTTGFAINHPLTTTLITLGALAATKVARDYFGLEDKKASNENRR